MKRSACFRGIGRTILITAIAFLSCAPPIFADDTSIRQVTAGGTVDPNGNFVLGYDPNSLESYALPSGTLAATNGTIGYWGVGIFYQSGGSAGFSDQLIFGHQTSGIGTYMLEGGTLSFTRGTLGLAGSGGFLQTSGQALVWDTLTLAQAPGAIGRYSLEGGQLLGARKLYVGYEGDGGFVQTGGTIDRLYINPDAVPGGPYIDPELIVGYAPGSTGTYELSGGLLRAEAGTIGYQGGGFLNQSGGSALFRNLLVLGHEAGGTGEVSLSGGTLVAGVVSIGKSGRGSFTQTGGSCVINPLIREFPVSPDTPGMVLGELSGGRGTYLLAGGWLGEISGGVPPPHPVVIGGSGDGLFIQTAGTHACLADLILGSAPGSSGTYVLESGLLRQGIGYASLHSACEIGSQGQGLFVQSGGTADFAGKLALGRFSGATGIYELSDGAVSAEGAIVGARGVGRFAQSGGRASFESGLTLGGWDSGAGTYELSGGTLLAGRGTLGYEPESTGLFVQSGGSAGFDGNLILGYGFLSSGTYRLTDGMLSARGGTIGNRGAIAEGGVGLVEQSGGSATFADRLILGFEPACTGTYVLSGGALSAGRGLVGYSGVGNFDQSGGQATFGDELIVRRGTYRLTGGTLTAANAAVASSGYRALFDQSGGLAVFQGSRFAVGSDYAGTFALSGGSLLAQTDALLDGPSRGVLLQSGGTATFEKDLALGLMVGHKGTYGLSDGLLSAVRGTVGYYGRGAFEQSGGSAAFSENLILGYEPGGTGSYALSGGSLVATRATVGYRGIGVFAQTGGSATCKNLLALGLEADGSGTYSLSGGTLAVRYGTIGGSGKGEFLQSGGSFMITNDLRLAAAPGGTGRCVIEGGIMKGWNVYVGDTGWGEFVQTGGTIRTDYERPVEIGSQPGSQGRYDLQGGSLGPWDITVGARGTGVMTQSGGKATLRGRLTIGGGTGGMGSYHLTGGVMSPDLLQLAEATDSTGLYEQSGGSLLAGGGAIGQTGRGSFLQIGGQADFRRSPLYMAGDPCATGYLEVSGGALRAAGIYVGERGEGIAVQSGGTVDVDSFVFYERSISLGRMPGSGGSYELSGGILRGGRGMVGDQGAGTFTQIGGTAIFSRGLSVGRSGALGSIGRGSVTFAGGSLCTRGAGIGVGGEGQFHQAGATCEVTGELSIGTDAGARGTFYLTDGALLVKSEYYPSVIVGGAGSGSFVQTGGSHSVRQEIYLPNKQTYRGEGQLVLGSSSGSTGVYELTAGTLTSGQEVVGWYGQGHFRQAGGLNSAEESVAINGAGFYELLGGSLLVGRISTQGNGRIWQAGGAVRTTYVTLEGQSSGPGDLDNYTLAGGRLETEEYSWVSDHTRFTQSGGTHAAGAILVDGRYRVTGGRIDTGVMEIRGEFTMGRWSDIIVGNCLTLGNKYAHSPIFHAEPLSTIHMTGPGGSVGNYSTDPSGLADLAQVWMMFEGSGNDISLSRFEVAGKDLGPTPAGYDNNFALGVLELAGTGFGRVFALTDAFDNQPDWGDGEALYVDVLMIHQGVFLKPGPLSLYYRNHGADVKRFFGGDANLDGAVDGGDLALMNSHWWRPDGLATREEGDLNGDGWVDGGDIALLGSTWNKRTEDYIVPPPGPPGGQAVPEPATLLILALGGAVLAGRRKTDN